MSTSTTLTLTDFLLARIAEDEDAARAVPPLGHNIDMGGNRQDERFMFERWLPSSADGMGNWSEHRYSPTTEEHFARHDPARVLAECEAKRAIVGEHERSVWAGTEYAAALDVAIRAIALIHANHPDYRDEWRP